MKLKYPIIRALATAIASYEFNKNSIIRAPFTMDGTNFFSNRQLIASYLAGDGGPFVVNDIHLKQADGIIIYLQQTSLMQTLSNGSTDSFLGNIIKILTDTHVDHRDLGILAWAPKIADDYQKKDAVRETSARFEYVSNYVGRVGEKIILDFTLIESRYIKSMDCHAVYGHNEQGNLIFYWAKDEKKIIKQGQIQGRVKEHKNDEFRNKARVTNLNYVKVI